MKSACPKCGFTYAWDGAVCGHCALRPRYYVTEEELKEIVIQGKAPEHDERIVAAYQKLLVGSNALYAAGVRFGAAGFICHHFPHLADLILEWPTQMWVDFGARTADDVLAWLDPRLEECLGSSKRNEGAPIQSECVIDGLEWFHNGFVMQVLPAQEILESLFRDMVHAAEETGLHWLRINLPKRRAFIQETCDRRLARYTSHRAEALEMATPRTKPGHCEMCGKPLGFWDCLFGRKSHAHCR